MTRQEKKKKSGCVCMLTMVCVWGTKERLKTGCDFYCFFFATTCVWIKCSDPGEKRERTRQYTQTHTHTHTVFHYSLLRYLPLCSDRERERGGEAIHTHAKVFDYLFTILAGGLILSYPFVLLPLPPAHLVVATWVF